MDTWAAPSLGCEHPLCEIFMPSFLTGVELQAQMTTMCSLCGESAGLFCNVTTPFYTLTGGVCRSLVVLVSFLLRDKHHDRKQLGE